MLGEEIDTKVQDFVKKNFFNMKESLTLHNCASAHGIVMTRDRNLGKVTLVLNAVSATWAILRRPILVAFYDTHGDTEDTFST